MKGRAQAGAGDNCCYANSNADKLPAGSLKFAVWNDGNGNPIEGGYASMSAFEDSVSFVYYASNGTVLYTTPPIAPCTF